MTRLVFDASALLALLNDEPGATVVERLLRASPDAGVVSAANFAETVTKLIDRGVPESAALQAFRELHLQVMPVNESAAAAAALLRKTTRALGLSLGDRCCLALAQSLADARVVTADRAWKALKGYRFEFIR